MHKPISDSTHFARRMALENPAICSHRFKTEEGKLAFCEDCRTQLPRQKINFGRTGKTERKSA